MQDLYFKNEARKLKKKSLIDSWEEWGQLVNYIKINN